MRKSIPLLLILLSIVSACDLAPSTPGAPIPTPTAISAVDGSPAPSPPEGATPEPEMTPTASAGVPTPTPIPTVTGDARDVAGWPTYTGAWFSIKYPPGFTAKPLRPSATSDHGYDSALFVSPDGKAEFYVYSPQWSGDISEIEADQSTERVTDTTTDTRDSGGVAGAVKMTWVTIKALDGGYTRAYYDEHDTVLNTRKAFGIKWTSQAAYNKYRPLYLQFRNSLKQFGD